MAKIPTLIRRITPSARVGGVEIPTDIADVGQGIEARGLAALGKGISGLAGAIAQIAEAEGVSQASTMMGQANSKMRLLQTELKNNNNPDTYEAEFDRILEEIKGLTPMSNIGAKIFNTRLEQAIPSWKTDVEILGLLKRQDLIQGAYIGDRNKAIASGNLDEANRLTIEAKNKTGAVTPEQAATHLIENKKLVAEVLKENAIQAQKNLAVVNPEVVKTAASLELKLRKEGKKPSQEFALLSNTDLESIRDYANSVGEKAKSDSKIAASKSIEESYAKIIGGDTDIASMITAIQADPSISDEDSNIAAVKIRTFFSTWNSAIDENIITSNTTRIKALKIISLVRSGTLTEDEGLEAYKRMTKDEKVNGTDGKQFINDIFAAAKSAKDTEAKRRESVLSRREKQIRDAVETQFSLFPPEDIDEILQDFANVAVIRFRDNFDEGDITEGTLSEFKNKVDGEVDDLIRKFRLSEEQQNRAVSARILNSAKTFKEQQIQTVKIITSLRREGKREEAKAITEEAISLGLFESEGEDGVIKKKKVSGKAHLGKGALKRILDVLK